MDQISNMIIAIKNASMAGKGVASVPYSKFKNSIANCLMKEKYIANIFKKNINNKTILELMLIYNNKIPRVSDVKRISKQSKRIYLAAKDIHKVKNGKGLLVLSTSKGVLSGRDAVKEQVGGEALFEIW